jgi:hypothetical protein
MSLRHLRQLSLGALMFAVLTQLSIADSNRRTDQRRALLGSRLLVDFDSSLAPHGTQKTLRACPMSVLGKSFQINIDAGVRVGLLPQSEDAFPFQLVFVLVNHEVVSGFVAKDCLDPKIIKNTHAGLITGLMVPTHSPSEVSRWLSTRQATDQSAINADWQSIEDLQNTLDSTGPWPQPPELRSRIREFLLTTRITAEQLAIFSVQGPPFAVKSELGQAVIEVVSIELTQAMPNCELVSQGLKMLQGVSDPKLMPGKNSIIRNAVFNTLSFYTWIYGSAKNLVPCSISIQSSLGSLRNLPLPRPVNAFERDQQWKRDWGVPTDEQISKALGGAKVIRASGDEGNDQRWIARTPIGAIEEVMFNVNAQNTWGVDYVWVDTGESLRDLIRGMR